MLSQLMQITRLDDYQSWMFEGGGARVILDPWLMGDITLPGGKKVFQRQHCEPPACTPDALPPLDGLLLSAPFGDHMHMPTLEALPRDLTVISNKHAAHRCRDLGFERLQIMKGGQSTHVGPEAAGLSLTAVTPAFPYAHNSLGFLIDAPSEGHRIYVETHVTSEARLRALGLRVDAFIAPVQSVRLMGVQFSMGAARTLRSVGILQPRYTLATGLNPHQATGLLPSLWLRCEGSVEDFAARLAETELETRFLHPAAGETVDLGDP
jgi:L-ascorbate metabolism protein UlaG (beta-lactamase superfamily)